MRHRLIPLVILVGAISLAGAAARQAPVPPYSVHEWGTFTSIAGADGQAVRWLPQTGPADLPCLVERNPAQFKSAMAGTVRMETPVLYFYAPQPFDASVRVRFPQGYVSEWYPRAVVGTGSNLMTGGSIAWLSVRVAPGGTDAFPRGAGASHYYAARETGADPLRVGEQSEKFLFYRGVGQFQPSIAAVAQPDGGVELRNTRGAPLGDVIVFENRRGAQTFSVRHLAGSAGRLARPSLDDASGAPLAELKRILVANGLYDREAQAMVETWKDSWFEEGARLLYIVPRAEVDEILPLEISPEPSAIARVFVGRMELMTPATIRDVKAALASNDRGRLAAYGRFLGPIAERAGVAPPAGMAATLTSVSVPSCR